MQTQVLFELGGKPVHRGDRLHVAPGYHCRAGAEVEAYCEASGGSAVFRAVPSGAVPTLPVTAVSWAPHPDTVDLEVMQQQGIRRPSLKDLNVWRLGRAAAAYSVPKPVLRSDPVEGCSQPTSTLADELIVASFPAPAIECPQCDQVTPAVNIHEDGATTYRCTGHGHRSLTWRIDVNGDMLRGAVGQRYY